MNLGYNSAEYIADLIDRIEAVEARHLREDEAEAWGMQAARERPSAASLRIGALVKALDLVREPQEPSAMSPESRREFAESRLKILRELVQTGWRPGEEVPRHVIEALTVDAERYFVPQAHTT